MATLRHKTTSSGVIVRWVPHPDHSRPSTYQVRDDAVAFLDEIGYAVPSPGDEVEIPWDVCRPLRVLGDLHFKSETAGDVDTGAIGDVPDSYGHSLTPTQRARLRQYIESHDRFEDASSSLEGEIRKLPRQSPSTPNGPGSEQAATNGEWRDGFGVGSVTRFSGSGNAVIEVDSGMELNLGPLKRSVLGEQIPILERRDDWGICLNPGYWTDRYLDFFKTRGVLSSEAGPYVPEFGSHEVVADFVNDTVTAVAVPETITEGQTEVVELFAVADALGVAELDGWPVWVVTPCPIEHQEITVRITGATRFGLRAVPDPSRHSGDVLDVRILNREGETTWGVCEQTLVQIPGRVDPTRDRITVGVSEVQAESLLATVADIPVESRPTIGSRVGIRNGAFVDYPQIPIRTEGALPVVESSYTMAVTAVDTVAVACSILPMVESRDIAEGTTLSVEIDASYRGRMFATAGGIPVFVDSTSDRCVGTSTVEVVAITPTVLQAALLEDERASTSPGTNWVVNMLAGFEALASGEHGQAATLFRQAEDALEEGDGPWAREAAINRGIAHAEAARSDGETGRAVRLAENLRESSATPDAEATINRKFNAELTGYAALMRAFDALSDLSDSTTGPERTTATAEVKRNLRTVVDCCNESALLSSDTIRPRVHPVLLSGLRDITAEVGRVHSSVSDLLAGPPAEWQPILRRPSDGSDTPDSRHPSVEPFDPARTPSEAVREHWRAAQVDLPATEKTLYFRGGHTEYTQTREVIAYVRTRADSSCEACGDAAPFDTPQGTPYLELHHVDEFETSAPNRPDRVIALCPTCHARVHYGADGARMNEALVQKLAAGLGTFGRAVD